MNIFKLATRGIDMDAVPSDDYQSRPLYDDWASDVAVPSGGRSFSAPSDYDNVFQEAGAAYGVDPAVLKGMAMAESAFRPDIISGQKRSPVGAIGLMQFMPDTARQYGINPLDPIESIFGAAAYMRKSLDKFDGDYGRAVASYNHGSNRDAYRHDDWDARIPPETQKYIMTVFDAADRFKSASVKAEPPKAPDTTKPKTAPQAEIKDRDVSAVVGDTTKSLAQGLLDVLALPGVAYAAATKDYDNPYLKAIRGTQEVLQEQKSPEILAREKALNEKLATAEGWREKLAVGGIETLKDPALLVDTLARSAPGMYAGGLAGRAAGGGAAALSKGATAVAARGIEQGIVGGSNMAARVGVAAANAAPKIAAAAPSIASGASIGTAAAIQGASVANDTYEALMKLPSSAFSSEPEYADLVNRLGPDAAKSVLASAAANRALAAGTAASVASMKLMPGGSAIETMFLPANLKGAAAQAAKTTAANWMTRPLTKGMEGGVLSKAAEIMVQAGKAGLKEGASEGAEEASGAMATGLERSRAGEAVNLAEIGAEAGGRGAAAGLAMGGIAGFRESRIAPTVQEQPTTPQAPIAGQAQSPQQSPPVAVPEKMSAVDSMAAALGVDPAVLSVQRETPQAANGNANAAIPQPAQGQAPADVVDVTGVSMPPPATALASGVTAVAGQPEQAQSLTVPEKGLAVIPSAESPTALVQRLMQPATPEQEQTQADTVVAEKAKPAPAYTPAVPQPGQAESIVGKAMESARKHADLADERLYSNDALQRISVHPQADSELKSAATNEIARREVIAQRKEQQLQARRSGSVLSIPDAPPLRPLSVERGIEIAKASRDRKLLPQEQGYMDALKSEIGDKAFDLVTRAGKAPFMTSATERKFDLPRLIEQNQSALATWDSAHNPAQQAIEAPQEAPVAAPKVTGLAAEMAAIKAKAQPTAKMDIAPVMQTVQKPVAAPAADQQMTTDAPAAPVVKQVSAGKQAPAAQVGRPAQAAAERPQDDTLKMSRGGGAALPPTITVDGKERPTTNSNGQQIAATEEGVRNFWRWFGDSKVVDDDGRPMVVYHGTDADFDAFNPEKIGSATDDGQLGRGYYFSTDPRVIGRRTVGMPVYLRAVTPVMAFMPDFRTDKRTLVPQGASGDSVILDYSPTGYKAKEIMVRLPEQIKSAIGNSGEFDPQNPSILKSDQGQTAAPQPAIPRTPKAKIKAALDRAYGRLFGRLEAKGLVTLTQTEQDAIEAAARARADKLGRDYQDELDGLMSAVSASKSSDLDVKYSADGLIQGFFDPATKRAFMVADALLESTAPGVLMHEVGIHMASDGSLAPLLRRASFIVEKGSGPFFDEVRRRLGVANETSEEERAAYLVEAYENSRDSAPSAVKQWFKDFMAAVRAWLFSKGVILTADQLTAADIAAVARANARGFARGGEIGDGGGVPISKSIGGSPQPPATATTQPRSLWRDETNRIQFAPGAYLWEKMGEKAAPFLSWAMLKTASPELRAQLRRMKLDIQKAQETAATVATESAKFSESEREMVSDLVEKTLKAGVLPPAHAVKMAALMNDVMGKQTDELIELGMLDKDTADRLRDKYLPRYYESKMGKKDPWTEAMMQMNRRAGLLKGVRGKHLKGRGLFEVVPVDKKADYEALGWEVRDPDFDPAKDKKVQMWRDFTPEEREKMGEIRDAGFRFVAGYMATQKDIALGRMYRAIANDESLSSRAPDGDMVVKVPDTKVEGTGVNVYGELAERYVSQDTLSILSSQAEVHNDLLMAYKKAMSIWKEGKTVLNPVSHMNNVVSNITMAHLAGVSYHRVDKYMGAIRDFAKKSNMIQEAKDAGLFLGSFNETELYQSMPQELRALAEKAESTTDKTINTAMKWLTFGLRKPMQNAYGFEDDFFKYLLYKDARSRGASPDVAVDFAQKYIFTYDDLPKTARVIRETGLPFFAYTYKAIPALLHTAMTQPHRMAVPATLLYGATMLAYAIAASEADEPWDEIVKRYLTDESFRDTVGKKRDEAQKSLPPWQRGYTAFMTPKAMLVGHDKTLDLPVYMDISRFIPGGDLFDVAPNAGGIPLPAPITPSHPVLSIGVAMIGNKDLFTGKDLVDKNDTRGEAALKRSDWMWKQIAPAISIGGYHYERAMNMIAQASGKPITIIKDYTGRDRTGMPVTADYGIPQTFGIKIRPVDFDYNNAMEAGQNKKLIDGIKAEVKQLARLRSKGFITDESFDAEVEKASKKIQNLGQGLTVDGDKKD